MKNLGQIIFITMCFSPVLAHAKVNAGDCNMTSCGSGSPSSYNLNGYDSETITPGAERVSDTISYVAQGPSASTSQGALGAGTGFTNSLTGMDSSSLTPGMESSSQGNDSNDSNK